MFLKDGINALERKDNIMRIVETKVYKFEELSDEAKEKAIQEFWDINVDFPWWESVYDDAKNIGLVIEEFDLDRGSYVKGKFIEDADCVAKNIIKEHGKSCDTVQTAKDYLIEHPEISTKDDMLRQLGKTKFLKGEKIKVFSYEKVYDSWVKDFDVDLEES